MEPAGLTTARPGPLAEADNGDLARPVASLLGPRGRIPA
ncbi:hypothetical protein SLNWT_6000 [Streptomyces albus]|uniref:Uncharacterized protein n=1 Tax=Streptomyces albus (strain ATCC 21838 / DSM 41398 / FERM P-419 / JCM 4703 / NBRC 107858) TaxID=1081613 RepID=A0A0B5F667_STRA4|nr:hypothetical protein SLNWT_6000 [Streptomyces albus]AOU80679.1 hypothetical protein SLNHY_5988 [Streptomyces albus]AYN36388.1 hypothetical protein DUI70_5894 [Streptomyces albus]